MAFPGALNVRSRPKRVSRGGTIAALDVGSGKVVCFIAKVDDPGSIRVVGIGHQVSRGVRAGAIVDMEQAETAIGTAVHAAETMAGEQIREVLVSLSGGQPESQTITVETAIAGQVVNDGDLKRALAQAHNLNVAPDAELIHSIPVGYTVDGSKGIREPRGMVGERLGVRLHAVTTAANPIRNLTTCIGRCHLGVEGFVLSPYASGLACLVEDEMDLGVTLIDMGGGTTSMSVFFDGKMIWCDSIPLGGGHVTNDIARGLTTPLAHAERLKTLYGSAIPTVSDEREIIDVPQVGEEEHAQANHVPKSLLVGIIQPRLEEIFELARGRLEASGIGKLAGRRVVLTGGASQLPGMRELAQQVLDKQVRTGRPLRIGGLAESVGGPAFSAAAGLLVYALQQQTELPALAPLVEQQPSGWLGRVGLWLRENL
ncbi:cell division protein FtsA [Rhodospirillum centenum]|uniref:Cell division protein FtsA n=1 Tax=Rhodospirillum centenum (strain ATCC 51521 / SW) TaxID=414684 RepID=B6IRF6_RHOCS|nr:cell division protein FtsA [Rhodospirillum centenum]ACI98042.1 cell division protein FtsA, putative [Rhodospirillum centenum SW]